MDVAPGTAALHRLAQQGALSGGEALRQPGSWSHHLYFFAAFVVY